MKIFPGFLFLLLAVIFQSFSGILGKYAAMTMADATIASLVTSYFYLGSLACLFLQAIVWQQALVRYPLSFAYPFMSLVNFIVLFSSAVLFHEGISFANIAGLLIISLGITLLSRSHGVVPA